MTYPGLATYPGPGTYPGWEDLSGVVGVVADPDLGNVPPRMIVQVANLTSAMTGGDSTPTIYRVDESGTQTPVRSAQPATLVAGDWTGFDYEAPLNHPVRYIVVTDAGATIATSAPATLAAYGCYLIHPGVPDLSCMATGKGLDTVTYPSGAGSFQPIGGQYPIIITDGVRKAAQSTLTIKSTTAEDADALTQLFADESVLLLKMAYPDTDITIYKWISVQDVQKARVNPGVFGDERRVWSLPYVEQPRPIGGIRPQATWASLMAQYATWRDVLAAFPTWRDVIIGS